MKKIKLFLESEKGKDVLVIIIVILVGLGSFELGRLSVQNSSQGQNIDSGGQYNGQGNTDNSTQTSFKSTNTDIASSVPMQADGKTFFASSKGTKYYSTSCSAGKTIKPENKVWFTTGEEAEKAGYTLSSACQ
jgi:hypothetical protein